MRIAVVAGLIAIGFTSTPKLLAAEPPSRGGAIREQITIIADIPYANNDNPRQQLDLFLPKQPVLNAPLPVIVFVHGGGWRKGDRRSGLTMLAPLIASGRFAGASIGYRLTDEASWPAQIHDCKAAIRWLRGNAGKHGLNADRIAVIGTSAGGHLVAMLGTSGGVAELEGDLGAFVGLSSRVQCVVDFFGPSDLATMGGWHNKPDAPEALLLGGPIQENQDLAQSASPIHYASADDPPFLMIHGTADPLVPFGQSVELQKKLEATGVTAFLIPIENGGHGRFRIPDLDQRIGNFLDNQLHEGDKTIDLTPIPAASPQR
jgi:acetyl esterase/lipase